MWFLLMTFAPLQKLCADIYIHIYIYIRMHLYTISGYRTYIYIHRGCRSVLVKLHPITVYRTGFGECAVPVWMPLVAFFGFTNCVLLYNNKTNTRMLMTIGVRLKHLDSRYFAFCNLSPPRIFLPLDLLSEYRIRHGPIGPFYVTSRYSSRIFYRGVSCFATDCPWGVWCRGLTTCLLYVGPLFENLLLNNSWAVDLT